MKKSITYVTFQYSIMFSHHYFSFSYLFLLNEFQLLSSIHFLRIYLDLTSLSYFYHENNMSFLFVFMKDAYTDIKLFTADYYCLVLYKPICIKNVLSLYCPVSLGCRIHRLHLWKVLKHPTNECSGYDTKQSDREVPVMLELWEMWITSSLPSLSGPLWPGVLAPNKILSIGQNELKCILMLNWITWNRTVLRHKLHT